ncbi:amino acid adenylation domain-containing protein [Streptomyces sp. NPDC060333]|uniref:amino acid adenylation domain-containing protein n=1 Tax=Streptomyces sp. NPDC060333 TaxID=3347098 RepID=UPI003661586F
MSPAAPLPARPDRRTAPLSYAQRAIWRAEQVLPGTALHNETAAFRLTGPVDADALERALAELAARHEVMRCAVVADEDGAAVQRFEDLTRPTVERVDLSGHPRDDRERLLDELVAGAAAVPFDLSGRPPLMRTHLFRLGEREHLLLFTAHHIVVDAWAFGVFLEELADRYVVETSGPDAPAEELPRPTVDFGDYAAWQRTDPDAGRGLDHWRDRLGGDPEPVRLPSDGRRVGAADEEPGTARVAGALHGFTLPAELVARLSALGRAELTSVSAVVLTAYCVVVQRYAGQDDLVVGMPVATRNRPALGGMIGPLLNVMAHRVDLSGTPTFREALHRTRQALKADLRHRDTPFDLVVEDLGPGAGAGRTPLFQLMYAFHSGPTTTLRLPGVETAPAPSHSGTAKYDLSLFLRPRPSGDLDASLEYRTALLAPETVAGFADALSCLLAAAADDPGRPIAELPVTTAEETRRIVRDFNTSDPSAPAWGAVPETLRALALRDGDAPAVGSVDGTLTRADVAGAADRVAAALAGRCGVRPGDRVALRVRRGAELIPLIVGLWRAGAVLVPLDAAMPDERAAYVWKDSGARLLVTDEPLGAGLSDAAGEGTPRLDPRELLDAPAPAAGDVPYPDGPAPDALAYLMYTSGSTGTPKGVAVPHGCVANLLHSVVREPGIEEHDVLVAVTSLTFDISVLELFAPLVAGARVVVAPRETVRDAEALGTLLEKSGATLMQATPSLWRGLLDGGWPGRGGLRAFSGGEALDEVLAGRLLERCAEVWNLYGPTETTIWSTAGRVLPGEPVTVGRPVARTVCHVLDTAGRPVPVGAVGELVIGGAGVTDGYWNRPELTSTVFVPDPVTATGGTVYRTGDLARYLPDGRLVVLGRVDQQVKILGHRVELGEVEALLGAHEDVRQVAVVIDRAGASGPRLVAFVVPARTGGVSTEALRRHLRERLPAAAVPAVFDEVAELPLNTSGKIDRPALTRTARTLRSGTGRTAPATSVERSVVRHWAAVLGLDPDAVGTDDDFLAAGGNSIAAGRLIGLVRAEFGQAPSLAAFYADPTPATLARSAAGAPAGRDAEPVAGPAAGPAREPGDPVPLTDQQRQLWLAQRLAPDSAAYNLAGAVRLDADVDADVLAAALRDLVTRHRVLAARVGWEDGGPVLVPLPADAVRLAVVDLPGSPGPGEGAEDAEAAWETVAAAEAARPFDLAAGPLLRLTLVRGQGRTELLCAAHHIAVDGWSVSVALRELAALYAVHATDAERLPAPGAEFIDYAAAADAPAGRAVRAGHLAYWRERLAGHPGVLALPTDPQALADEAPGAGRTMPVRLSPDVTARLRRTAARLRVTPFTVLLTVFGSLLGRYAASDDVVVAVPVANREAPGLEGLVGNLVNTLPVRVDLSGTPGFAELASRTGRLLAADLDRPLVPFDRLVAELGLAGDPGRPALAQVSLVWQDATPDLVRLGDVTGELRPVRTATAKYDLTLALDEHVDRIDGVLEYAVSRFGEESAARFVRRLETLLHAALDDPDADLDDVDLGRGETPSPRPAAEPGAYRAAHRVPVHELFRAVAAERPDAPAVRCAGVEVTYAELDRWSDDIAVRLLARGAGPGSFVSVLLPTGPAQSAAVLGVAKTGAAFAVLDGVGPELRLRAVLADADPVALLATEASLAAYPALWDREAVRFGDVPVEWCDTRAPAADKAAAPRPTAPATTGEDALCLVYTSGSTGSPKGIVLPHATLAQFAHWQGARFSVRPGSRVAQWAPFTYDAAYTEVFAALCHGATLCVPPDGTRHDPVALAGWLRAERITQIQTVPGFLTVLTEALDRAGEGLPDLEHLLLAGEALPPSLAAAWAQRPDRPALHNLYGPTECVLATHRELKAGEAFPHSVPIGVPIPGREALVLDHRGRPCPVGVVGEIHLRSDLLAGSYRNRPEESAKAYVPDPWRPGGTLYRTGDLGRFLPNGELAFTGRTGSLVKIRGNRVELEEIEALLESHPAVREAAAALHDRAGAPRLIGYAVVAEGVSAAELRAHLAERLPAAVVPETVVLLDALPRTRTNKRDRARLPVPAATAVSTGGPPSAGAEQVVADAWRRVLGGDSFGRHTNFFEAGGDSLLAARLQMELGERLGREIRLVDVFARPTVAGFVSGLGEEAGAAAAAGSDEAGSRGERRRAALRSRRR